MGNLLPAWALEQDAILEREGERGGGKVGGASKQVNCGRTRCESCPTILPPLRVEQEGCQHICIIYALPRGRGWPSRG